MKTLFNIIICLFLLSCTKDYIIKDMAIQKQGREVAITFEVKNPVYATVRVFQNGTRVNECTIVARGRVKYWYMTDKEGLYTASVEINKITYDIH